MIKLSQIIILNVPKREREGKYLKKTHRNKFQTLWYSCQYFNG